jgi:hypothetical protein
MRRFLYLMVVALGLAISAPMRAQDSPGMIPNGMESDEVDPGGMYPGGMYPGGMYPGGGQQTPAPPKAIPKATAKPSAVPPSAVQKPTVKPRGGGVTVPPGALRKPPVNPARRNEITVPPSAIPKTTVKPRVGNEITVPRGALPKPSLQPRGGNEGTVPPGALPKPSTKLPLGDEFTFPSSSANPKTGVKPGANPNGARLDPDGLRERNAQKIRDVMRLPHLVFDKVAFCEIPRELHVDVKNLGDCVVPTGASAGFFVTATFFRGTRDVQIYHGMVSALEPGQTQKRSIRVVPMVDRYELVITDAQRVHELARISNSLP